MLEKNVEVANHVATGLPVRLVVVSDAEGNSAYYNYLVIPPDLQGYQAVELIDAAIRKVKAANPEAFTFDELMAELAPHSIHTSEFMKSPAAKPKL